MISWFRLNLSRITPLQLLSPSFFHKVKQLLTMNIQEDFFRGESSFEKGIRCSAEIQSTVCLLYTETQIKNIIKTYSVLHFYCFNSLHDSIYRQDRIKIYTSQFTEYLNQGCPISWRATELNELQQTNLHNTPVEEQVSIRISRIMQSWVEESVVLKPGHLCLRSAVRRPTGKSRRFTLPHCKVARFKHKGPIHNCVRKDEKVC